MYRNLIIIVLILSSCKREIPYSFLEGQTMGTTYHITVQDSQGGALKTSIDSLLEAFNMELSTYIASSTISRFNQSTSGITLSKTSSQHFYEMMVQSRDIYLKTDGAFDPSVGPLVEYYGFGTNKKNPEVFSDKARFQEVKELVGFNKIKLRETEDSFEIIKADESMMIDFSSIAKGYGVDIVSQFLEDRAVENYLVEIGGESRAKGVNTKGKIWTLGINTPDASASLSEFISVVKLKDKALATSGNYRNFYNVDSITYVHIIDPVTGISKPSDILSSTILADDCATADAIATASIVMGAQKAMQMIDEIEGVEACMIIAPEGTYELLYSRNYKNFIND
jgi:thiamine biosynthesis lipoprotein